MTRAMVVTMSVLALGACQAELSVRYDWGISEAGVDASVDAGAVDASEDSTTLDSAGVDSPQGDLLGHDQTASDAAPPDQVGPDTISPDAISPDLLSPDLLSPDTLSPDLLSPDLLSPDLTSPTPDSGPTQPSWLDDTSKPCPNLFSQLGLFPDLTNRSVVDPRALRYVPRYPLYTDGAGKDRWIFVPAGKTIDNSTRAWSYPPGTVLFKHFEYPGQPVETRVLRTKPGSGDFEFCVYQWNTAGTDATLLSGKKAISVTITSKPTLAYEIPSHNQCKDCHDDNAQRVGSNFVKVQVIGFDELRLNHTLAGQTQTQLAALAAKGLFSATPPAQPDAITGTAAAIAAKGWVHGNCAHCHNNGFKFDAIHSLLEASTVNVPQSAPLIKPKDPSGSQLYQAAVLWATQGVPDMPKIGVVAPDPAAKTILEAWINEL